MSRNVASAVSGLKQGHPDHPAPSGHQDRGAPVARELPPYIFHQVPEAWDVGHVGLPQCLAFLWDVVRALARAFVVPVDDFQDAKSTLWSHAINVAAQIWPPLVDRYHGVLSNRRAAGAGLVSTFAPACEP